MAKKDHEHGPVDKGHPDWSADSRWTPLTAGFMVASIIGFFVSILYVYKFSLSLAISFAIVFLCMFFASMISMRNASPDAQLAAKPIK
jgi:hypothetical protein